jgi:RNA polymerase sigma factor (sigma-70 family)
VTQPSGPESALGVPPQAPAYVDRAFDAFVQSSMPLWVQFADLHVGDRKSGELIACEIAFQLHEKWEHVLAHGNPHQHAMDLLRGEIVRWCAEHGITDAMAAHATFRRTMRAKRNQFAVLEESIGVFSAISRLPERQYLAFVLRHVLGCGTARIAHVMNVSEATVHTTVHHARRHLAAQLAMPLDEPDRED